MFCEQVLLDPALFHDERFDNNVKRVESRSTLYKVIVEAFSRLTAEEVVKRLDAAGIANARVNSMHDLMSHPQLRARNRWATVSTSEGPIPALLPPGSWEDDGPRMSPIPALGEHTDQILLNLGYGAEEISTLRARGVI